jgi:hypothetical protein
LTLKEKPWRCKPHSSYLCCRIQCLFRLAGLSDYDKLIEQFGTRKISQELLDRFEKLTGRKPHRLLRRETFFSHRSVAFPTQLHLGGLSCISFALIVTSTRSSTDTSKRSRSTSTPDEVLPAVPCIWVIEFRSCSPPGCRTCSTVPWSFS